MDERPRTDRSDRVSDDQPSDDHSSDETEPRNETELGDGKRRIQIFVEDEANRGVLAELLEPRYEIVTEVDRPYGDLFIVDDHSFSTYRELLETETKNEPFAPVVLVHRSDTQVNLPDESAGSDSRVIDEVIEAPVDRPILFRRLSNLLVRRQQMDELEAANAELEAANAKLEVANTQLEATNAKLEATNAELENANERLEGFASVVSHDLRNPLQVAQGQLTMLDPSEHVDILEESLDRMESLIDDVLLLAREGTAVEDPETLVLESVAADAWSVVESDDATLSVEPVEWAIRADRTRLRTLFENLFRNAVEHGGNDVAIRIGACPGGFYVADDGVGIDPSDRADVLEKGFTTSADGTGLGLSIVTDVAVAHGWNVTVEESQGGGARFEITGVDVVDTS